MSAPPGYGRSDRLLRHLIWRSGVPVDPFPVRHPGLAAARDLFEVEDVLGSELAQAQRGLAEVYEYEPHVPVNLGSADVEGARHFADGLLLGAQHFPDAPVERIVGTALSRLSLEAVGGATQVSALTSPQIYITHPDELGRRFFAYAQAEIKVDTAAFLSKRPAKQRETYADLRATDRGSLLLGMGASLPTPTGVHEYLHVVEKTMAHPEWRKAGVIPGYPNSLSDDVRAAVALRVGKPAERLTKADYVSVVGEYAATTLDELVAVLGTDAIMNGPNAEPISRLVYDRLQAAVRPFEPGPGATLSIWLGRARTRDVRAALNLQGQEPTLPPELASASPARSPQPQPSAVRDTDIARLASTGLTPAHKPTPHTKHKTSARVRSAPTNAPIRSPAPPLVIKHRGLQDKKPSRSM
ncbi:hypothetical protein ACIRL2_44025 [Embleya sp. NPDC127516]|uniref:hypothetical protein n=1 Tax=Embleya sp. NPDC127516 TaxID=3363990 RepID=UPI0037FA19F7